MINMMLNKISPYGVCQDTYSLNCNKTVNVSYSIIVVVKD